MTTSFKHLKRWQLPDSYFGAEWPEHYVFMGQHRDSDSLSRSNFMCTLDAIGGESDTVQVVRESHWAVGWIEWIAIHESDTKALEIAESILKALEDYPVVNEDHWSNLEYEEACEYWERMSIRDRVEYCQRAGVSIFGARHAYIPQDDNGYLFELLTAA